MGGKDKDVWVTVSYATKRLMNATSVIRPSSKLFLMCCIRFRTFEQHDLPGRKPACCGVSFSSTIYWSLVRIIHSKSLYNIKKQYWSIALQVYRVFPGFPGKLVKIVSS